MAATAFCPAYVTGIFSIGDHDAAGAGFCLDIGLATTIAPSRTGKTAVLINGAEISAPVSKAVLRRFKEKGCNAGLMEISHNTKIPIGFGLGMSAAGALSLSLALNEFLGSGFPREECVKIAHDSEVECGTGLSGADAAAIGGALFRKDLQSAPQKLPIGERKMHLAFYSPIRTAEIIRSPGWKEKVNIAGNEALSFLSTHQTWEGFVGASRHFAEKSGLGGWCQSQMKQNGRASMAMLGHTLFSDTPFFGIGATLMLMEAKTSEQGARLL